MIRRPFRPFAALVALPALGGLCGAGEEVELSPRVARQSDASFDGPAVPDAALAAPGEGFGDDFAPSAAPFPDLYIEPSAAAPSLPAPHAPAVHETGGVTFAPRISREEYRAAYHAVPFNLAESRANPGYRHEAAMKFLTGDYPPAKPVHHAGGPALTPAVPLAPAGIGAGFPLGVGGGVSTFGAGIDRFGFGRGLGYGPAGIGGLSPAQFPGLLTNGGVAGPRAFGPAPFAFDRIRGAVPTFVNRYRPPGVFLPAR